MGQWTHNHNHPAYDADGQYQIWANMPTGALVGMISPGSGQQGLPFIIGKDFYNFSPRDTGRLYLRMNDGMYSDNNGQQTVTIWRTN